MIFRHGAQEISASGVLQAVVKLARGAVALTACGNVEIQMQHRRGWIVSMLLAATPVVLASLLLAPMLRAQESSPTGTPTPHRRSHKAQKEKELALPPMPSGPLSQLPMDQIPASPAKVSYQGGLLAISAQNSTLGEILRDVRKLTGAAIDIPQGSGASERVVGHFGPGAPRDILVELLNGTSFNYVMVGSNADPSAVASVILTSKSSSSGEAPTQTAAVYENSPPPNNMPPPGLMMPPHPQPFMQQNLVPPQPGQAANAPPATAEDDSKDDDQDAADENADDQAQPAQPGQPAQPDATDSNAQVQPMQPDPNSPNAGPRTPEQVMDMLRRAQPPGSAPSLRRPAGPGHSLGAL